MIEFSLPVEDLAQFAHNGTVSRQLDFYLRRLTPEQQAALADLLTRDFDPSTSAHYFDSRRKLPDPDCF
ncbi:alpha/beta hydrolase, partial [Synechococcus sp. R6-7]|uniref:alpha/beta hydrolase n=1 Tax=Synechococcus sp. R6-7 TaxID=2291958 RepID=UPI0039C0F677